MTDMKKETEYKIDRCKNVFRAKVIDKWNDLTSYIVHCPTLKCFKNRVDDFMDGSMNEANLVQ